MLPSNPMRTAILTTLLVGLVLLGGPQSAQAGCGCDKPPPEPAAVIPNAAFSGMKVTLFSPLFVPGQQWTVQFRSGTTEKTTTATVQSKRDITTASLGEYTSQLVVTVPNSLPLGPTRIEAYTPTASLTVLEHSFTVIGQPLTIWEGTATYIVKNYQMAVGADSTLYLAVNGMNNVCQPMSFGAQLTRYPVRFDSGDVVIRNFQGYLIDLLDTSAADHFEARPGSWRTSDQLYYFRHSFEQFCTDHQIGHIKEVDSTDPNWHKDGTPHTDYSAIIFAIAGSFDNGSQPQPGSVTFNVHMTAKVANGNAGWAREQEEENVFGLPGSGPKKHK